MRFLAVLLLAGLMVCCTNEAARPRAIGEAYAGPVILSLRHDIGLRSPVVGTAKHGERLQVIDTRRRFIKVRNAQGIEGWVDLRMLLSKQQMDELRRLAGRLSRAPSQGSAVVLEALNMHADPNRLSPSFYQLPEKAVVSVLDRRVTVRSQPPPELLSFPRPKPRRRTAGSKGKEKLLDLPPPAAPKPPPNWIELSQSHEPATVESPPKDKESPAHIREKKAPEVDDWSLIRSQDGRAGWVLSRMINMAIPDEVAQYAEGHRITSYFSLGRIQDEENGLKDHWLWTTMAGVRADCDFDSFRVFIWNRRRHRYETAYIEKRILGHYPVEAHVQNDKGYFSLITEDENGKRLRRSFVLDGYQVHRIGEEPYVPVPVSDQPERAIKQTNAAGASWFARMKRTAAGWFGK